MVYLHKCSLAFTISVLCFHVASSQFNPTILQDSRDLPKTDGTFGFLYRTEDGIAHAAKGDADGVIHGRFSYTDPTGLKVNYNYNAGSRVTPGYSYNEEPTPRQYEQPQKEYSQPPQPHRQPPQQYNKPQQQEYDEPQQYNEPQRYREPVRYDDEPPQYVDPQPKYVPRTRPSARSQGSRQQYSAQYRESVQNYQARRTRPPYATHNEVFEDYN